MKKGRPASWGHKHEVSYLKKVFSRNEAGIFVSANDWGASLWEKHPLFPKMLLKLNEWKSRKIQLFITGIETDPFFKFVLGEDQAASWHTPSFDPDMFVLSDQSSLSTSEADFFGEAVEAEVAQFTVHDFFGNRTEDISEAMRPMASPSSPLNLSQTSSKRQKKAIADNSQDG